MILYSTKLETFKLGKETIKLKVTRNQYGVIVNDEETCAKCPKYKQCMKYEMCWVCGFWNSLFIED